MNRLRALSAILFTASCVWAQPGIRLKARPVQRPLGRAPRGPHYVLHFSVYPGPELRQELARRGIRVLQYVPENGLMVSSRGDVPLSGLPLVEAGSLQTTDKISPLLAGQVTGAVLAIFYPDIQAQRSREIARSAGFDVIANQGLLRGQLVLSGPLDRVPELAAFDEVEYVLPASADLAAGAPVAGCAGAVTEAGPVGEYVLVGRGWQPDPSGRVDVGYVIRSVTEKLDSSVVRSEIERALHEWTKYAGFSLTAGQAGAARTIEVLFARGAHGDGYPFDGAGGTLAHTFYPSPPNPEPVAGDMHLDADEPWHTGAAIDVFSVALHEAGHALGLGHSDRPGSVMYPYYRQVSGLSDDDIAAIRALYGEAGANSPPPDNPPVQPADPDPPTGGAPDPPPVNPGSGSDTSAPSIAIQSPAFTIVSTTNASLSVSGVASDNVGITSVKWSTSSGDSGTASGTTAWSATVPLLSGTTVLTVRAYDAAGNSGWRAVTIVRR